MPIVALVVLLLLAPAISAAQSPPPYRPLNPLASSRGGAAYEPIVDYDLTRLRVGVTFEYSNAIDLSETDSASYLLDAELGRASFRVVRDLSPSVWVGGEASLVGTYAGFADGFFEWYHGLIRYNQAERDARPWNSYAFEVILPDGTSFSPPARAAALGDLRLTAGIRHGLDQQSTVSVTLPTATATELGAGLPTVGISHTLRMHQLDPVTWELSAGAAAAPRHGSLAGYQNVLAGFGTTGVSIRLSGGHSIYGFFYYHSPCYHGTSIRSLDGYELTADFGWQLWSRSGNGWRIGFTEDLAPRDLGIDLVMKVSGMF